MRTRRSLKSIFESHDGSMSMTDRPIKVIWDSLVTHAENRIVQLRSPIQIRNKLHVPIIIRVKYDDGTGSSSNSNSTSSSGGKYNAKYFELGPLETGRTISVPIAVASMASALYIRPETIPYWSKAIEMDRFAESSKLAHENVYCEGTGGKILFCLHYFHEIVRYIINRYDIIR
jgi:hypothetical protein